jgi:hypothetical protein
MPDKKNAVQSDQARERFGPQGKLDSTRGYQASGQVNLDEIEIPEPSGGVQPAQSAPLPNSTSGD